MFHPDAVSAHSHLFHGYLREISTLGLVDRVYDQTNHARPADLHRVYAKAAADLAPLLDEVRFSGALASLYMDDFEATGNDSTATVLTDHQPDLGIPIEVIATLQAYSSPLPDPVTLFYEPHTKLAGDRILSLWFAGQLLDSALFRSVAVLDRLAALLWCAAGKTLREVRGKPHLPAFRKAYLDQLTGFFPTEAWDTLYSLTVHPLFDLLMDTRNGFTHSHRQFSELHGHYRVAYNVQGDGKQLQISQAIDKETHRAIV